MSSNYPYDGPPYGGDQPYGDDQAYGDDQMYIEWGPWKQLPNGGWHREGQDASGNWYQEDRNERPKDLSGSGNPRTPRTPGQIEGLGEDFNKGMNLNSQSSSQSNYHTGSGQNLDYGGDVDPATTGRHHKSKSRHTGRYDQAESSSYVQERGKSSRSSKGDSKGSSKNAKSSRADVKGKGRESEQPAPTALQNFNQFDESSTEYGQTLQDVANIYQRGSAMGSQTAAPMLDPAYVQPGDEREAVDRVPPLQSEYSKRPAYPRSSRVRAGPEDSPLNEDLNQYVVHHSREFAFGTVIKLIWSEPMGVSRLSKHGKDPLNSGASLSEFGQRDYNGTLLYEGIRRFIVIDGTENGAKNGNSICVPIATYKRQGCTKHGIKAHQHGIIYTPDKEPLLLNNEPDLGVAPIRLVVSRDLQGIEKLAPESRINYSKHVTIEHNTPVYIIGRIHHEDRDTLGAGVDENWEKRVRDRKKDKKQERHKGSSSSK